MKNLGILLIILLFTLAAAAQKRPAVKRPVAAKPAPVAANPAAEKARLDALLAASAPAERIEALKKFIAAYPNSDERPRAADALVAAYAALGDEKLLENELDKGVAFFTSAAFEIPKPIPARLFAEVVSKFPANLYYRGQRGAAVEIASMIENKAEGNSSQLLALAAFYLGIESGGDARRLAEAAALADPASITAYQTLGLAHRLNFDLEESAKAYEKALELDPESSSARRSLAEMKRALGKADESAALYREVLAKYDNDIPARTGLILSLFDAGKKAEAETELAKSLEQIPNNLNLLAGAAYWYAANDQGGKAVEYGQKAVDLEPRFIWSHIALARGLMSQNKPVDAERVLINARRYGNFPTLEYEIASARLMSGFYREAVEELRKSFTVKDGQIQTKLGRRVPRDAGSFTDLISAERRASIFEPIAADNAENAAKLKILLQLSQKLDGDNPNSAQIAASAEEFVRGDDKMKLHRQLYAASLLLQKQIAVEKAADFANAAVGNADAGLEVAAPAAAVMANELYESRTIAFARGEMILIPDVPGQMLSAILRGRIEELNGWALYQQNNYPEAIVRLRRSISVLPDKSAWWRSSVWRLGLALEADGKDKEALDNYVRSYKTDKPDIGKYITVENLYKKINGGTDGLEAQIGPNPLPNFAPIKPENPPAKTAEITPPSPDVPAVKAEIEIPKPEITTLQSEPAEQKIVVVAPPVELAEVKTEVVTPKVEPAVQETAPVPETVVPAAIEPVKLPEESKTEIPTESFQKKPVSEIPKEPQPVPLATPEPEQKIADDLNPPAETAKPAETETQKPVVPETPAEVAEEVKTPIEPAKPSPVEKSAPYKSKGLFDPIVITVPKNSPAANEPANKSASSLKVFIDDPISIGELRTRAIKGRGIKPEAPALCKIDTSQESISILNNGGSIGILVGIDRGDLKDISAESSSPKDVVVKLEPAIGGSNSFYIIKSTSPAIGIYQVIFKAPCGEKELLVRVR
ncbi:MAG: tetratricopeptide repeat protein [Pyrinomonadaceae bacterium]